MRRWRSAIGWAEEGGVCPWENSKKSGNKLIRIRWCDV
jgi:hypothetical protein